jgi:hypothetical protein
MIAGLRIITTKLAQAIGDDQIKTPVPGEDPKGFLPTTIGNWIEQSRPKVQENLGAASDILTAGSKLTGKPAGGVTQSVGTLNAAVTDPGTFALHNLVPGVAQYNAARNTVKGISGLGKSLSDVMDAPDPLAKADAGVRFGVGAISTAAGTGKLVSDAVRTVSTPGVVPAEYVKNIGSLMQRFHHAGKTLANLGGAVPPPSNPVLRAGERLLSNIPAPAPGSVGAGAANVAGQSSMGLKYLPHALLALHGLDAANYLGRNPNTGALDPHMQGNVAARLERASNETGSATDPRTYLTQLRRGLFQQVPSILNSAAGIRELSKMPLQLPEDVQNRATQRQVAQIRADAAAQQQLAQDLQASSARARAARAAQLQAEAAKRPTFGKKSEAEIQLCNMAKSLSRFN